MTTRQERPNSQTTFISGLAGLITAYALVATLYRNELRTSFDWLIAITLLALGTNAIYFLFLPAAWKKFQEVHQRVKVWGILLAGISAFIFIFNFGLFAFIPFFILGFMLVSPGLSALQRTTEQKQTTSFILAWALGAVTSFFASAVLRNFYQLAWEIIIIIILLNSITTLFFTIIVEQLATSFKNQSTQKIIPVIILLLGLLLFILSLRILFQYPTLFPPSFLIPDLGFTAAFVGISLLSQSWTAILLHKLDSIHWRSSSFILWIKRNLPGLLLASAISASTYLFATVLVSPNLALADNYFDTDSPIWVNFLTANTHDVASMRAVHPYAMMMLRPPVWLLSLLLDGNKFHAALLLNALVGGLCVYLTWVFFKQRTNNTGYALIAAALLGFSNSHLLMSTFLESYIFSAAILITSVALLQHRDAKLTNIVPVGLVTFGITITNFIQTCITFLLTQWDIKKTIRYAFVTVALATVLTFAQTVIQPNSQPFYVFGNLTNETAFQRDVAGTPVSVITSRANVIGRTMTLFSVIAPRPLILLEEIGCSSPCFNTIRYFRKGYEYASYIGFGSWLARFWFVLLGVAGLLFVWSLFKSPKNAALQIALALNLLFNFVLHMNYGDDPMLYSPNWTYALVFFVGLSFEKIADKKWLQIILLLFLTALLFNNIELFHKMLDAILPYFG